MKKVLVLPVVIASFASNSVMTSGILCNADPLLPNEGEFYRDGGITVKSWTWCTGGNCWSVWYDEVRTGGCKTAPTNAFWRTHLADIHFLCYI